MYEELDGKVEGIRQQLQDHGDASQTLLSNFTSETAGLAGQQNERIAQAKNELEEAITASTGEIETALAAHLQTAEQSLDERIEKALKGTSAQGILQQAATLWEEKERRHLLVWLVFFGAFLASIVALISVGYQFSDDVLSFIKKAYEVTKVQTGPDAKGAAPSDLGVVASTLSRIILVSFPLGMLLWVLRAFLRLSMLNMSLREDAAQRRVMIQTYVNLVSAGSINDDRDRALILSAIFRPLPGEQEADVSQPTLADLMAMGGKK